MSVTQPRGWAQGPLERLRQSRSWHVQQCQSAGFSLLERLDNNFSGDLFVHHVLPPSPAGHDRGNPAAIRRN
jgi:hypothetical protein